MSYDPSYGLPLHPDDQALLDSVRAIMSREEQLEQQAAHEAQVAGVHDAYAANAAVEEAYRREVTEADALSQLGAIERQLGRPLTGREVVALQPELADQMNSGRDVNLFQALGQLEAEGNGLIDTSDHGGRVAFMTARAEDLKREQLEQEIGVPPVPSSEAYDLSDRSDRVAWMQDMASGADAGGRQYNSPADGAAVQEGDE